MNRILRMSGLLLTMCIAGDEIIDVRAADDDVVIDVQTANERLGESASQGLVIGNIPFLKSDWIGVAPRRAVAVRGNKIDPNFDRMIFGFDGGTQRGVWRLKEEREIAINELDEICKLTELQKRKLDLAGRGDCKRFFERVDTARQKYIDGPGQDYELQVEIDLLQAYLDKGLLRPVSIFAKTIQVSLTEEQLATLDDSRRSMHLKGIEELLDLIHVQVYLRTVQRNDLKQLILSEIPPSRIGEIRDSENYTSVIIYRFATLEESKVKSLLDEVQWLKLGPAMLSYRDFETRLLQEGLIAAASVTAIAAGVIDTEMELK